MSAPSHVRTRQRIKQISNSRKQLPGWSVYKVSHEGKSIPIVIRELKKDKRTETSVWLSPLQSKESPLHQLFVTGTVHNSHSQISSKTYNKLCSFHKPVKIFWLFIFGPKCDEFHKHFYERLELLSSEL